MDTRTTPVAAHPPVVFFTSKGYRKNRWLLDTSSLRPTPATLMGGKNFEDLYLAQLESILYHDKESPKTPELLELASLCHRMSNKAAPVHVSCTLSVRRLPHVIATLNRFFLNNLTVILSVTDMLHDNNVPEISDTESVPR